MKKKLFLSIILFQMTAQINAQSFEYIYSTSVDDGIRDAVEDSNGNIYLVGSLGTFDYNLTAGIYDALIIKLSSSGDTVKTKIINAPNDRLRLDHIIRVTDSLFIGLGTQRRPVTNDLQIYFLKFDQDLNILDEKTMGSILYHEYYIHYKVSLSNDILLAGLAEDTATSNFQILFYKISMNGDSIFSYYYSPGFHVAAWDLLELPDTTGYLLFTFGWPSPNFQLHNEITKINAVGAIDTIIEIPLSLIYISAEWISDSIFITNSMGYEQFGNGDLFMNIRKFDLGLNFLDSTSFGIPDTDKAWCQSCIDFIDTSKIYVGSTYNWLNLFFSPQQAYYNVARINSNLDLYWEKYISYNNEYLTLWKVLATQDGGVLLAGTKYNAATANGDERDIYVIKLDSLGNFVTGINELPGLQVHDVIVYPNPVQDVINIKSTINFSAAQFILYDEAGRIVLDKKFFKQASFFVSQLNAGIYFYEIKNKDSRGVFGKIIKE